MFVAARLIYFYGETFIMSNDSCTENHTDSVSSESSKHLEAEQPLNDQLNAIYAELLGKLTRNDQQTLITKQHDWQVFRDATFLAISKAPHTDIARSAERGKIILDRAEELLIYLKKS